MSIIRLQATVKVSQPGLNISSSADFHPTQEQVIAFSHWFKGERGDAGADGKSAYQIWLEQGHTGTEEDFLEWLKAGSVQSDWNQNDSTAPDFIKGKPENIVQDADYVHTDNNYTTEEKEKLSGIEVGAQANVQTDWEETDATADDYIKNKPSIPTLRTMNGEQLTDSSLGDINIHDGFYFPNAVQDYDGNWYGAVVIGDQVWLGENLKTTHYDDGTAIEYGGETFSYIIPYYSYADYNPNNKDEYGLLYNHLAIMNGEQLSATIRIKGIAPDIFYVPTIMDYQILADYLNEQFRYRRASGNGFAQAIASTNKWKTSSTNWSPGYDLSKNNSTGFNAVPAGNGSQINEYSLLTTCSEQNNSRARSIMVYYSSASVFFGGHYKGEYTSVRCISSMTPIQFRDWYIRQYGSLQHHLPQEIPTVNNAALTISQGSTTLGTFTANQATNVSVAIPQHTFIEYTNS